MTRATSRALKRIVLTMDGDMVLEVTDRVCAIRPLRARRGGPAEVTLTWGQVYQRALFVLAEERRREKDRARREKKRAAKKGGRR